MTKTKIEWANYSWNPIKGVCPVGCWYCYARRMYRRFKWDAEPWLDIAELNQVVETRLTGKRVFVCSTFEIFSPVVDKLTGRCADGRFLPARDLIFDVIERRSDLTFIILTKLPHRIDRPMPENVWLGTTVTGYQDWERVRELDKAKANLHFVSMEPLLEAVPGFDLNNKIDWLIVGRLTGHGRQYDPTKERVEEAVYQARCRHIPVFLKNNLREIWGEPLIQEYPR